MWGNPTEGRFGVISKALGLAISESAYGIYVCSGIPKIGGREFSPDAKEFMEGRINEIVDYGKLKQCIRIQNNESQTTREEVIAASPWFEALGIERVICVTVPKHAPRALQEILVHQRTGAFHRMEIMMVTSDIDFPNATIEDVAILEAPHRHDSRKSVRPDLLGKGIIEILRTKGEGDQDSCFGCLGDILKLAGATPTWETVASQ